MHRFYTWSLRIKMSSVTKAPHSTLFPHFLPLPLFGSFTGMILDLGAMQSVIAATPDMDAITARPPRSFVVVVAPQAE